MNLENKSYQPTPEKLLKAEESMTFEQSMMSKEREYLSNARRDERREVARKRVIAAEDSTGNYFLESIFRQDTTIENIGRAAKFLKGVTYATVSWDRPGHEHIPVSSHNSNRTIFQLWNEEPWLGVDGYPYHVDRGMNGTELATAIGNQEEIIEILKSLGATLIESPIIGSKFPGFKKGLAVAKNGGKDEVRALPGCPGYTNHYYYKYEGGEFDNDGFPVVFKIDTTPKIRKGKRMIAR
jgi:hypothetical protein